jgi:hypothetical protein
MPAVITKATDEAIPESATAVLTAQLVDEDGANIDSSAVTALVATLTNHAGAIVNSRNALTILGANGGTLSSTGLLTQVLAVADTVAVEAGPEYQQRSFTIKGTHSGGKTLACEVRFYVRKLTGHP